MLNAMRSGAKSWVVKVFLGLLVLSFALWGVGDIFLGSGSGRNVAEVDGKAVSVQELDQAFQNRVQQFSQLGANLTREQAVSFGLMGQALNDVMLEKMVERHAEDLGLSVADEEIVADIRNDPQFGGGASFDRQRFELFLRSSGLSEEGYVTAVRGDLLRTRLLEAFAGQINAPDAVSALLASHRGETRSGRLLTIDPSQLTVEPASDEDLSTYLTANEARYMAPQYRSVEIVILDANELAEGIEPSEAQIAEAYDRQIAFYTTPATRTVNQLLATDVAILEQAMERISAGEDAAAVAEDLSGDGLSLETLGPFGEGELPEPLNGALWSALSDGFGDMVESAFGFHRFQLTDETAEIIAPLAEKSDEIAADLALQEANELLPDLARALDDEIAAGETLAAAAQTLDIPYYAIEAVDGGGRAPSGDMITEPFFAPDMLQTIFASEVDRVSLLEIADDDRQYVFNIRSVIEPRVRELDEVRDDIQAALLGERQLAAAQEAATELLADVQAAGSFDGFDEAEAVSVADFGPVERNAVGGTTGFEEAGLAAIFAASEGTILAEPVTTAAGPAIAILDAIAEAPAELADQVKLELAQALQGDLLALYAQELQKRYPGEINQALLAQLMAPPDASGGHSMN